MRLLNVHSLEFREYHSNVPKYVIASHRWSAGSEARLKDVRRRRNTETSGYKKVEAFAQYVRENTANIEWLWIDTCCIDDKSSQEVSEAINSMFKWYSGAEVCLAYLADVDSIDRYAHSDWWKRGWTLQELLAPPTVVFLTRDWKVAGNKGGHRCQMGLDVGRSLEESIASLTGIHLDILRDFEESKCISAEQKLAWAEGRQTTREEDLAYCLFGIFGVAIGANYGEGQERARARLLREIANGTAAPQALSGFPVRDQRADTMAVQRLMESLHFPQMDDRRESIQTAHEGTYRWALLSTSAVNVRWDNLAAWLGDPCPPQRVYWVNAKPGAGKSGLIRFLDKGLQPSQHMQPWAGEMHVVRLSYYFWNPGHALQKSLAGVIRTILHQLFDEMPETVLSCVPRRKFQLVRHSGGPEMIWSDMELRDCFRKVMAALLPKVKILCLIDGLDEIDGDDDNREDLVSFLQELAGYPNAKLCVSSRRWTLFQDAFALCPQLRLEDLNAHDIEKYIKSQLQPPDRSRQMPGLDILIREVIARTDGVFLWTRLVVKDLSRGLRDGDSLDTLREKLNAVPGDLNEYFTQLLYSIEPHHRMEAGILLQLALHEEDQFVALNPLRLLDLIFIGHAGTDFALESDQREQYMTLFDNVDSLLYTLDSTLRRLSSRCKRLLQCNLHIPGSSYRAVTALPPEVSRLLHADKHMVFSFRISFMHRSLRDYLLESAPQELLGGIFDSRNYLRNARLLLMMMSMNSSPTPRFDVGLASYFVSTLSIAHFRGDDRCALFAATFRPVVESVMESHESSSLESYWYVCRSLNTWHEEQSSFLTLAIDFGLTAYVDQNLTAEAVRGKSGRPLLDHILRPRFGDGFDECSIGNRFPIPEFVQRCIRLGADVNQAMDGGSVWTLFLSFAAEYGDECADAYSTCIEHMVKGGASMSVPHSALSKRLIKALAKLFPARYAHLVPSHRTPARNKFAAQSISEPFCISTTAHTGPQHGKGGPAAAGSTKRSDEINLLPACGAHQVVYGNMVSVDDILKCMWPGVGDSVDRLVTLVRQCRLE